VIVNDASMVDNRYLEAEKPAEALAKLGEFQILCAPRNAP
jgi:hypothetical protein